MNELEMQKFEEKSKEIKDHTCAEKVIVADDCVKARKAGWICIGCGVKWEFILNKVV